MGGDAPGPARQPEGNPPVSNLCPQCLGESIVAPVGSPTCRHHDRAGLAFWPEGWAKMTEPERVNWLLNVKRNKTEHRHD